jgi:hypothetical protein
MADDPYVYTGTDVLRNHFGIRDAAELAEREAGPGQEHPQHRRPDAKKSQMPKGQEAKARQVREEQGGKGEGK